MQVGFIGLGHLGTPIAENLLEYHKDLLVYNRTKSKTKSLEEEGATVCSSVRELASKCDIVFTIVSNDAAIKEITEGENGIAKNLKENGIHISMSTICLQQAKDYFNCMISIKIIISPARLQEGRKRQEIKN